MNKNITVFKINSGNKKHGKCFIIPNTKADEHPLLATFSGYVVLVVSLVYTITYEKAFTVPKNMERLKNLSLVAARSKSKSESDSTSKQSLVLKRNPDVVVFWPEFKREVQRIRNVGIKVGSFHHMERMSTLNFIDFVLRNVVNLLVLSHR